MLEGGLPLREWVSNYPSALDQLSTEERSSSNPVKVLGYFYDVDLDALQLKQRSLNTLGSVFDPIGVFNPILMQSKLFIRSLCRAKLIGIRHLMRNFLSLGNPFVVLLRQLVVCGFLEEHLIQIVPSNFVYLLMLLRRLMDVLFMLCKMIKDICFSQKLKLVH